MLEKRSKSFAHRFGALEVAMRENDLMIEAKEYLKDHPRAALVNLGCGLDQTAENCDNGKCMIYNLDLPDVIVVRNELLPESGRIRNISADLYAVLNGGENNESLYAGGVCRDGTAVKYGVFKNSRQTIRNTNLKRRV